MNEYKKVESANKIIEQLRKNEQKQKDLMTSYDYINWLESFTEKHPSFSDEDWIYCPDKIEKNDCEQIANLQFMYSGIREYAREHNISANACFAGDYYCIKYNNVGYEIGVMCGQGVIQFCKRISLKDELDSDKFIDIKDIIKEQNIDKEKNVTNGNTNLDVNNDSVLFYRYGKEYYFKYNGNVFSVSRVTIDKLKQKLSLPFKVTFSGLSRSQIGRIIKDLLQESMNVELIKIMKPESNILLHEARFMKKKQIVPVFKVPNERALYTRVNNNNPYVYTEINGKKILMEISKDDAKKNFSDCYFLAKDLTTSEKTFFDVLQSEIECDYVYSLNNEAFSYVQNKRRIRKKTKI